MKIAATYLDGEIFQHFGHTEYFKIYETDGKTVQSSEVVSSDGFGHGALAGFLKGRGVDALVCGGIGGGAVSAPPCLRARSNFRAGRTVRTTRTSTANAANASVRTESMTAVTAAAGVTELCISKRAPAENT